MTPLSMTWSRSIPADFFLVIIGPRWLGSPEERINRINDVADPIRIEIEAALRNGLTIVPVLVEGAPMPPPPALPDTLEDFAFINAAEVASGRDFHSHLDRVIRFLDEAIAAGAARTGEDGRHRGVPPGRETNEEANIRQVVAVSASEPGAPELPVPEKAQIGTLAPDAPKTVIERERTSRLQLPSWWKGG
jgi:hypothetical protein